MTVTLVRPSGLPYDGSAFASFTVVDDPLVPVMTGGGSLADDSDATFATIAGRQDALIHTTIVAVDFAAVPGLTFDPDANGAIFNTMFRVLRLAGTADDATPITTLSWAIIADGSMAMHGGVADAALPQNDPASIATDTITTYVTDGVSSPDYVLALAAVESMRANPFTLVVSAQVTNPTLVDVLNVYEVGLLLDLAPARRRAPSCRKYPRAPDRRYPPPGTRQAGRLTGPY